MATRIRPGAVADARGIAIVHVESWRAAYRGLIDQAVLDAQRVERREELWTRWLERTIAGLPSDGDGDAVHRMLVAEAGGTIAGWATFGRGRDPDDADRGELAGLYVLPDRWGSGIGRALIEHAVLGLRAAGWSEAFLWVLHGNERAIRFYGLHDWHADGTERLGAAGGATELRELRLVRRLG